LGVLAVVDLHANRGLRVIEVHHEALGATVQELAAFVRPLQGERLLEHEAVADQQIARPDLAPPIGLDALGEKLALDEPGAFALLRDAIQQTGIVISQCAITVLRRKVRHPSDCGDSASAFHSEIAASNRFETVVKVQRMIIWGTTIKRRKLGWVADFCPICAKPRAHRIVRVGSAGHLWYISIGSGSLVGHEVICATCEVVRERDATDFTDIAADDRADLGALIRETCPDMRERFAVDIDAAERIQSLTPDERHEVLMQRLAVLAEQLERQYAERPMSPAGQKVSKFVVFLFVAFFVAIIATEEDQRRSDDSDLYTVFGLVIIGSVLVLLYFLVMRHPWFMKHRFRPQLRRALQPLDPSIEELDDALGRFKRMGLVIGKKFKPAKMHKLIEANVFSRAD